MMAAIHNYTVNQFVESVRKEVDSRLAAAEKRTAPAPLDLHVKLPDIPAANGEFIDGLQVVFDELRNKNLIFKTSPVVDNSLNVTFDWRNFVGRNIERRHAQQ